MGGCIEIGVDSVVSGLLYSIALSHLRSRESSTIFNQRQIL